MPDEKDINPTDTSADIQEQTADLLNVDEINSTDESATSADKYQKAPTKGVFVDLPYVKRQKKDLRQNKAVRYQNFLLLLSCLMLPINFLFFRMLFTKLTNWLGLIFLISSLIYSSINFVFLCRFWRGYSLKITKILLPIQFIFTTLFNVVYEIALPVFGSSTQYIFTTIMDLNTYSISMRIFSCLIFQIIYTVLFAIFFRKIKKLNTVEESESLLSRIIPIDDSKKRNKIATLVAIGLLVVYLAVGLISMQALRIFY